MHTIKQTYSNQDVGKVHVRKVRVGEQCNKKSRVLRCSSALLLQDLWTSYIQYVLCAY